jgi:hypothetical protein
MAEVGLLPRLRHGLESDRDCADFVKNSGKKVTKILSPRIEQKKKL